MHHTSNWINFVFIHITGQAEYIVKNAPTVFHNFKHSFGMKNDGQYIWEYGITNNPGFYI